jgi:hypothetical protein
MHQGAARPRVAGWLVVLGGFISLPITAQMPLPDTEFLPIVDGTPETRSTPFGAWITDLSIDGYTEEEFLVSGMANIYAYVDDVGQDPAVTVSLADQPYTTRILVRRPQTARAFNGTVYLEVLNPTFFYDVDFIWEFTYRSIIDDGAAWVGVTSKPVAADFLRDDWGTSLGSQPLPLRNNSRYARISMPMLGQVWDILGQVGALLKTDNDPDNPMVGFGVERIIMVAYSQSAGYQVTYANSFHAAATMPDSSTVFDGYYISAGSFSSKRVNPPDDSRRENHPAGDARNLLSRPLSAPVVRFQTQWEMLPFFNADTRRQTETDDPLIRTYELAGAPHLDLDSDEIGGQFLIRDLGLDSWHIPCELPLSPIRSAQVQSALLKAMDSWIRDGTLPPASRLIQISVDANGRRMIAVDADGNAIGGVRHPTVEAPLGTYLGKNEPRPQCILQGAFIAFDQDRIDELYPTHGFYVQQVERAVTQAIAEGFLLPGDAQVLIAEARQSGVGRHGGSSAGIAGLLMLAGLAAVRWRRRFTAARRPAATLRL